MTQRLVQAGHEVAVVAPSPHYPKASAHEVARQDRPGKKSVGPSGEVIHRVGYVPNEGQLVRRAIDEAVVAAAQIVAATKFTGAHRPDVVVGTSPPLATGGVAWAVGRLVGAPIVLEMRDAWPDLLGTHEQWSAHQRPSGLAGVRRGAMGLARRAVAGVLEAAQRGADAVVVTTESFAQVLRSRGVSPVSAVRNHAAPVPSSAPRRRAPGEALRVVYLGTLGRSQGLDAVVRAAAVLRQQGVPVEVTLMGSGAREQALRELAAQLDAPVQVVPGRSREDAIAAYAEADSVLVSLRDWAPFEWTVPSKLYEALGAGRHVTAVLAGEGAQIVRDAGAGDVVPPGDVEALVATWRRLAGDPESTLVGDGGRRWVAQHADADVLAAHYVDVLSEVSSRR